MNLKYLISFFVFFVLFRFSLISQSWQSMDKGVNNYVRVLFADTIENTVYAGGNFSKTGAFNDTDGIWVSGITKWTGAKWDSLGCGIDNYYCINPQMFPNATKAIVKFNNEIYVGGSFSYAGGIPVTGIAKWNSNNWDTVTTVISITDFGNSEDGAINGFLVYNNELYVVGLFDSIAGIAADMIAKYDGTNWYNFPDIVSNQGWQINAAIFYKDKLYVGGNFSKTNPSIEDIARFNFSTNQWETVGGSATCDCWVNKLYIYHDTLIVAGYFQSMGGQLFNNIAAWDGDNWIDMDGGLMPSNVFDVIEYDNYLYACGQISYLPDNTPINRMAKWDGQQWTDAGVNFGGASPTKCLQVLNNDLYIGGGFVTFNGDTVNNIVKYTAAMVPVAKFTADSTNTCQGFVNFTDQSANIPTSWLWNFGDGGTSSQENPSYFYFNEGTYTVTLTATNSIGSNANVKTDYITKNSVFCDGNGEEEIMYSGKTGIILFPNPSAGKFTIRIMNDELRMKNYEVKIYNVLGEEILHHPITSSLHHINLSAQPSGIYFYQINAGEKLYSGKIIKE